MLTDITLEDLHYIAARLRQPDKEEIFALLPYDGWYRFGWDAFVLFRNNGRARVAWHKGKPAAVIGITEMRPGVWEIALFGTDDFKAVAFECMRWARATIRDLIDNHGGKRLQCDSRVGHEDAWRFLKALGAEPEGPPMKCFGKDGSSYQRFVWLAGRNEHRLAPAAKAEA